MSKQLRTAEYLSWVCRRVRLDDGQFVTGKQRHDPTWLRALQDMETSVTRGTQEPTVGDNDQAWDIKRHFADRPADQAATPYLCKLIATLKQETIGTDECGLVASAWMVWDRVQQSRQGWQEQQRKWDEHIAKQDARAGARRDARRVTG